MDKQILARKRSEILQQIRNFFTKKNFLEVETPIMVAIPGMEPHLTPFETEFKFPKHFATNTISQSPFREQNSKISHEKSLFLNHSPELQMKKLLGQDFEKIFNITKVFRNGEIGGPLHNPEFTMLEWYRQKADYKNIMKDCENLITHLVPSKKIKYQNDQINLKTPWSRKSVRELFLEHCKIDLLQNKTFKKFHQTAKQKSYDTNGCKNWDDIFFKIFLNHIEPDLDKTKPLFIYDYPASQAALAKISKTNPFFAERFELYIGGIELANAFSELLNAKEQKKRLIHEQNLRKKLKKTIFDIDEEFLLSLESIKHPSAGIALGIDRLMMLLLDQNHIEKVLLFPLSKELTNN